MLPIPYKVTSAGSAKPDVKPISKWRAVTPAQAHAQWVRFYDCCSSHTQEKFMWFLILQLILVCLQFDSGHSCFVFDIQFTAQPIYTVLCGISVRKNHNYCHNCIVVSRRGIKQNNTFVKMCLKRVCSPDNHCLQVE